LHCFAGCNIDEIVEALGIQKIHLSYTEKFSSSNNSSHLKTRKTKKSKPKETQETPEFVAKYDYFNNDYELVFRIAKFRYSDGNKEFKPYHENNNRWKLGLGDQKKILYNLPAVRQAVEAGETIFYVEGEKDADTMTRLGYTATTHPFGGASFEDDYIDMLAGAAEVIIIPDNDKTGDKMVKNVADKLHGHVGKLKVLCIPGLNEGEDVTDWIEHHGGSKERLKRLKYRNAEMLTKQGKIDKMPEIITAEELYHMDLPDKSWAVPDLIPTGLTIVAGVPKVGKSWMCLHIANAIAEGGYVFGKIPVDKKSVLYYALEDGRSRIKERINDLNYTFKSNMAFIYRIKDPSYNIPHLRQTLENNDDLRVVVIDVLKIFQGEANSSGKNQYDIDYEKISPLQRLATEFNAAIIGVHHFNKRGMGTLLEKVSGTYGLTAAADTIIGVERNHNGQSDRIIEVTGRDIEDKSYAADWDIHSDWLLKGEAKDYNHSPERNEIYKIIKETEGSLKLKQIAEKTEKPYSTVQTHVRKLLENGKIYKPSYGKYSTKE